MGITYADIQHQEDCYDPDWSVFSRVELIQLLREFKTDLTEALKFDMRNDVQSLQEDIADIEKYLDR